MKINVYLVLLLTIPVFYGCNSAKSLYKKGNKMESAQLNKEASNYYYQALLKKPEFIEARDALNRSGGQVMNDYMSTFFNESQMGNKKVAIDTYLEAKRFKETMNQVSVKLSIPPQYTEDFNEIKKTYLLELYEQGLVFLDQEDYESAEEMFKEIGRLEPDYKDTKKLKDIAYIEPLYRKGVVALENLEYRSAYNAFLEVLNVDDNYKDSKELQKSALDEGIVTIGLISFENATTVTNAQKKAEAYTLDELNTSQDPFLKVIDRTNYQQLLNEQKINLSGAVDESSAAEAGKLLGVKWLLGGSLLDYSQRSGKLTKVKKDGFKAYKVKKKNEEGEEYYETKYKRTVFYEYKMKNSSTVSVQVKLTSLTSGEIEVSKILSKEMIDTIHYYEYEGDGSNLYPSEDGQVDTDRSAKQNLNKLLNGRKNIQSVETLSKNGLKDVSVQIKSAVEKFCYYYVK